MRNQRRLTLSVLAALLCLVAPIAFPGIGPAPARAASEAEPTWAPPTTVGRGVFASVAVGRNTTTVAWNSRPLWATGAIRVRRHVVGRGWEPTRRIGSGGSVEVATNRSNVAVAAWFKEVRGGRYRVMAARGTSAGTWAKPRILTTVTPPRNPNRLHVAVSDNRAAVVWWDEEIDETYRCESGRSVSYVAYSTPSGKWDSPHSLNRRSCYTELDVGIGSRGNVTAIYTQAGLRMDTRKVGRGWTRPEVITRHRVYQPQLLRTPGGGTLVAVWQGTARKKNAWNFEARRRTGDRWGPLRVWKHQQRGAEYTWDAAMDARGNSTLAVMRGNGVLTVTDWKRARPVGPEHTVLKTAPTFEDINLATNDGGDSALWFYEFNTATLTDELKTMYRARGGAWTPPQLLQGPDQTSGLVQLAVRASGAVVAVWDANRRVRLSTLPRAGQ